MSVNSIQSSSLDAIQSQYTTTTETEKDTNSLRQEDFLTIFLAQLQYQDPLNPMESTDMASQLCQYSMLEQQIKTNDILETVSEKLDTQENDSVMDYIGKEIEVEGSIMIIDNGDVLGGSYTTEESAYVEIVIYDSEGNEVRHLYPGQLEAGSHEVEWDGEDSTGNNVEDGAYTFEVTATDDNGGDVTVETKHVAKVTGVSYEYETPYLMAGDLLVDPETVVRVFNSTGDEAG